MVFAVEPLQPNWKPDWATDAFFFGISIDAFETQTPVTLSLSCFSCYKSFLLVIILVMQTTCLPAKCSILQSQIPRAFDLCKATRNIGM